MSFYIGENDGCNCHCNTASHDDNIHHDDDSKIWDDDSINSHVLHDPQELRKRSDLLSQLLWWNQLELTVSSRYGYISFLDVRCFRLVDASYACDDKESNGDAKCGFIVHDSLNFLELQKKW